ncbi:hypothetical protein UK82_29670 [Frankia sp. ACN1ag]|nr:XRE family transcriptional regulator [Frankia sp. ACN1ag]KQC34868.1 hypothetical protein UK82_29670 [Frankia sp. ACN1ag]
MTARSPSASRSARRPRPHRSEPRFGSGRWFGPCRVDETQPRVSALERGELDSVTLSALRACVGALGGKLRIVADFGDREYRLT